MKIKLTESKLNQIVAESVKKVLNENTYNDSPILKWMEWCYNYTNPQEWIPTIWGGAMGDHMMKKFNAAYSKTDGRYTMEEFMRGLSIDNQRKLIDYVMGNF